MLHIVYWGNLVTKTVFWNKKVENVVFSWFFSCIAIQCSYFHVCFRNVLCSFINIAKPPKNWLFWFVLKKYPTLLHKSWGIQLSHVWGAQLYLIVHTTNFITILHFLYDSFWFPQIFLFSQTIVTFYILSFLHVLSRLHFWGYFSWQNLHTLFHFFGKSHF